MTQSPAGAATAPAAFDVAQSGRPGGAAHKPDTIAVATLAGVAILGIALSWALPWWTMKARAPQYGQRTLVIDVGPRTVEGDVREVDLLGHYVGIAPMGSLARFERAMAPIGIAAIVLAIGIVPWIRRRWLRVALIVPAVLLPAIVLVDLKLWMTHAVNARDPDASLNLTVNRIDPKIFGAYDVGQFKVETELGGGFYVAALSGVLAAGLAFTAPLAWPRRRTVAGAVGAAVAAASLLSSGSRADAAEWIVGRDHATVAAAVAAAADGDTVVVPSGVHRERLVIDRAVRVVGRTGAVLDGGGEGTVVRINAGGVELRGLTLRGSGSSYTSEDAGVRIDHAAGVSLVDLRIEDALFGVFAAQADHCVIADSTIVGKDLPHVRRGDGIRLWYSSGCRLTGNLVERSRDVVIWYSSDTVVEDNVVRTSRYGLHYMYSDRNVFRRNRFEDNQVGAAIMYSRGIELAGNAFSFSAGPAAYGLLVKDADDVFITGNRFVRNATGMFFDNAPQAKDGRVEVRGNLVARNDVGIAVQPLTRRIRLWENAWVGNRTQVQVVGTGSADGNVWTVDGRGNFWSDAVLYDADGDGVSDLPYRLESTYEALADRHPALAFFDATPAADAIDLAARLFPIFTPRPKLTDTRPLTEAPLTAWTRTEEATGSGVPLAVTGAALMLLTAVVLVGGRHVLA